MGDIKPREEAYRKIAEGLQLQSQGYAELALLEPDWLRPGMMLPQPDPEELLTIAQAAGWLQCDEATVYRLLKQHPEAKRKVGSRLRVEKHALLRATRKC